MSSVTLRICIITIQTDNYNKFGHSWTIPGDDDPNCNLDCDAPPHEECGGPEGAEADRECQRLIMERFGECTALMSEDEVILQII